MSFRVTSLSLTAQSIRSAAIHNRNIAKYQERLTTGLRINRPSDDPVDTRAILNYRGDTSQQTAQLQNIQVARSRLNSSVTRLLEAKDLLVAAKGVALQTTSSFERDVLATQVGTLLNQFLLVANTQVDDTYLFAGTATDTRPFTQSPDNGASSVQYAGTSQRQATVVAQGLTVDTNYAGDTIFMDQDRQSPIFRGATGAQPGTGTDSGVGRQTLLVRHTSTTLLGASGITSGASSSAQDTVIGQVGVHRLEIHDTVGDGSAGTVSLNGGPAVAFTSADSDLRVTGPFGEQVFVNTTNITAGFQGTIDLTASGTLSLDGGVTETAIDFSANQPIVDSRTGLVTHVDSRQVHQAGDEDVFHAGTMSAFDVLKQFRDDLSNSRGLTESEWQQRSDQTIGELDRYIDHLLQVVGEQSSTLESLDSIETRNQDVTLELQRILSDIESVDVTDAVVKLQTEQNLLQYTYSVTAQLFQLKLLDYV